MKLQTRKPKRLQKIAVINKQISKVSGYKATIHKSAAFNNEATEGEIKKTIPFIKAPKIVRYQRSGRSIL